VADEYVLYGVVEHVSHVKYTGYVGGRYHYRVGFSLIGLGMKEIVLHPIFVPFFFYFCGIVFAC
jgi:hypothetical protein